MSKAIYIAVEPRRTTYWAVAAAVACVRFELSIVVLGVVRRKGEMARVVGEEENWCTWAVLVLERERIAPLEGRKGIILTAIVTLAKQYGNWS